jgi:hypothetical protein
MFRQRMKEEKLIHPSFSAYFNDENNNNNFYSVFHNCFHSYEIIDWLIKKQLCKTPDDGQEIFQVLEKLKIIHHGKNISIFRLLTLKPIRIRRYSTERKRQYTLSFRRGTSSSRTEISTVMNSNFYRTYEKCVKKKKFNSIFIFSL